MNRTVAFAVLACLCVAVIALGGFAVVDAVGTDAGSASTSTGLVGSVAADEGSADEEPAEEAAEPVRHRHPEEIDDDGDLASLRDWLADRLAADHRSAAIELSEGEYDAARSILDEDHRETLERFVTVADETDAGDDRDAGADPDDPDAASPSTAMDEATDGVTTLADLLEAFDETAAEYDAAVADDDTERALELAGELEAIGEAIDSTSDRLAVSFDLLTETTADLSEPADLVESTVESVRSERVVIRQAQFPPTELTVEPVTAPISASAPPSTRGTLRTADGEPVAEESISVTVADRTGTVRTDETGAFPIEYRPTTLPLEAESITVRYEPAPRDLRLASEAAIPISVRQVTPDVTVHEAPDRAAFGESLPVRATIVVEDEPVDDVTLEVALDGEPLGTVEAVDGVAEGVLDLPATMPDGDRELSVGLTEPDRALAPTAATRAVEVVAAESRLDLESTLNGEGDDAVIRIEGTLAARPGGGSDGADTTSESDRPWTGVGDLDVELTVDGERVGSATTDADGSFATSITAPAGESVTVAASHDGADSSLEPASASSVVEVGGSGSGVGTLPIVAAGALALVGLVIATVAGRRFVGGRSDPEEGTPTPSGPEPAVVDREPSDVAADDRSDATEEPAAESEDPVDEPDEGSPRGDGLETTGREDAGDDAESVPDADAPGSIAPPGSTADVRSDPPSVTLDRAERALSAGRTDGAVTLASLAARRALADAVAGADSLTYREFATAYEGPAADSVAALADAHERATYAAERVPDTDASAVLEIAHDVCDDPGDGPIRDR